MFAALLGKEAPVIRLRYEKCGQSCPGKAGYRYPAEEAQNARDNAPFEVTAWRRTQMRAYMHDWRARSRPVRRLTEAASS